MTPSSGESIGLAALRIMRVFQANRSRHGAHTRPAQRCAGGAQRRGRCGGHFRSRSADGRDARGAASLLLSALSSLRDPECVGLCSRCEGDGPRTDRRALAMARRAQSPVADDASALADRSDVRRASGHRTHRRKSGFFEILGRHQHYAQQGVTVPKGLLFVGPPGTGKTQTAKVLSGEAGLTFISLSTADAKVDWIGWSAKKIKEIFVEARTKAASLIWLDELDALCPSRGHYLDCLSQEAQATAELLTQFDGLHSNGQAIVVAATNRLDMVDGAVLSRFTEHIQIGLPGPEERMALLRLFLAKTPLAENGSLKALRKHM